MGFSVVGETRPLLELMPELAEAPTEANVWGIPLAEDVVTAIEHGSWVPLDDAAALFASEAWTPAAMAFLRSRFTRAWLSPGRRALFAPDQDTAIVGQLPNGAPTLASILDGQIGQGWFAKVLSHVAPKYKLSAHNGGRPKTYAEVDKLARQIGIDTDALGYAWLSDALGGVRFVSHPQDRLGRRVEVLMKAAVLKLGQIPSKPDPKLELDEAGEKAWMVVDSMAFAMRAGFDPDVVYDVFIDRCASEDGLLDLVFAAALYMVGNRPDVVGVSRLINARYLSRQGRGDSAGNDDVHLGVGEVARVVEIGGVTVLPERGDGDATVVGHECKGDDGNDIWHTFQGQLIAAVSSTPQAAPALLHIQMALPSTSIFPIL